MTIALIGNGAIAQHVTAALATRGLRISALLLRTERVTSAQLADRPAPQIAYSVADLPAEVTCVVDCAGHAGLRDHGAALLRSGRDVITVSLGALADDALAHSLQQAAVAGNARLHLVSGAIGALDCLRAARTGSLTSVRYVGRKPPQGWLGSPAEDLLNLSELTTPATHFTGTAREAARLYPKNANVAAAVALAGIGFDRTQVALVADPNADGNIHQIEAEGAFGHFQFTVQGLALADNPRSSALAAMSVVSKIEDLRSPVAF